MVSTGVGISQNVDGGKAAEEAYLEAVSQIKEKPTFILVFATIDYEKNNGFQNILNKIADFTKNEIPVVGGTTSGFMANQGVFSRGVAILATYMEDSVVTPLAGRNTKGNPEGVAKQIAEGLKGSNRQDQKNKILIEFIAGPTVPRFPIVNRLNFISSKLGGAILTKMGLPLTEILGYGVANDDIILFKIREQCPDYFIIGGAVIDSGKLYGNYQFFGKQVMTNSMVCIGIQTNSDIHTDGIVHMEKTETVFNITKTSGGGTVIDEINGEPAFKVYKEKLNLTDASFKRKNALYRTTLYYPISTKEGIESSTAIGAIYGNHILIGHRILGKRIELLTASGKRLLEVSLNLKEILMKKSGFLYVSACETSCEAVGAKIYRQKQIIDNLRQGSPYLVTYFGGEHYSAPNTPVKVRTHSFNILAVD